MWRLSRETRTIVRLQVSMKDLRPLLLPIAISSSDATCPPMTAVRMVTVVEGKKNLHEVVPNSVFGDKSVVSLSVLDDRREVAAPTVFHEDIQNACISVHVSVVITYNVFVVEVLQNVARGRRRELVGWLHCIVRKHSHFSNNLLAIPLRHALKVKFLAREDLRDTDPSVIPVCSPLLELSTHDTIGLPANFANYTKRAITNNVQRLVKIEWGSHDGRCGRRGKRQVTWMRKSCSASPYSFRTRRLTHASLSASWRVPGHVVVYSSRRRGAHLCQ